MKHLVIGSLLVLGACTPAQQQAFTSGAASVQPALQTACTDAMAIANIAGLVRGVGAIVPYLNAGCGTAEGLVKLAADPSSTEWVGQLSGQIKGLASAVGIKIARVPMGVRPYGIVIAEGVENATVKNLNIPDGYAVTITKSGAVLDGGSVL